MAVEADHGERPVARFCFVQAGEELLAQPGAVVLHGGGGAEHGQHLLGAFDNALLFGADEADEALSLFLQQLLPNLARLVFRVGLEGQGGEDSNGYDDQQSSQQTVHAEPQRPVVTIA